MPFVRDANQFVTLFVDTFRSFGRGTVWLVLFAYFVLVSLLLYSYFNFMAPVCYPIARLTATLIGGGVAEKFFHYPGHFLYLPTVFGWAKTVVAILGEGIFLGSAAILLRQGFLGEHARRARGGSSILSSWGHFMLASLAFNVLIFAVTALLQAVLAPMLLGYARRTLAFELVGLPGVYSLILAMFFFVIPRIALYREGFFRALVHSLRSFRHRPFSCFFLAATVLFVPVLLATAANHPDVIIEKFHPELVFWILWLGLAADLLFNFIWMGTAVRHLIEEEH